MVKPSARSPSQSDDCPAAFAAAVPRLVDRNVRLMGGCCGTSDAHVAALAAALAHTVSVAMI
jgi:methionine synthase I (cobalamin-dependent)